MPCAAIEAACSLLSRIASRPPCTLGCSVFTRPSIISGKPVSSATSSTLRPASASALRGAAGRDELDAVAGERAGEIDQAGLVGHREQGAGDAARVFGHERITLTAAIAAPRPPARRVHGAGGRDQRERPLHPHHFAGAAVDHDLHGAARPVGAGEIDALLEVDAVLVGAERPHLLVRQHQHGAVRVGQPVGLDGRMQMEAHRELVAAGRRGVALDRREHVLAVEPLAVGREHQGALVDHAETRRRSRRARRAARWRRRAPRA